MKLLTISDLGVATGFARVMNSIIDRFPNDWDINSLAINYFGDPHTVKSKLYPASSGGDLYGYNRLGTLLNKLKPDKIFILQDSWIIEKYLDIIPEDKLKDVTLYVPVDAGPYQASWLKKFPLVHKVCAYTEFGKDVLLEACPDLKDNICVIPHGINKETFYPIDQLEARETLGKIDPQSFIFLNVNRNQPRKRIDICAKAFGIFSSNKEDVRYFHHAGIVDAGWNIQTLARRYGFENKLILSHRDLSPQTYVSDDILNNIYNSADMGLNLSGGEGFGLCFAPGTEVFTTRGFKTIENIGSGDQVFDSSGAPTTVTNTFSRYTEENLIKLKISGLVNYIYVTKEHPFLTLDGFVKAEDLTEKSRILRPDIQFVELFSKIDLTHYGNFVHDNKYIYFNTNKCNVGLPIELGQLEKIRRLFNSNISIKRIRRIERYLPINKDLVYILYHILTKANRHPFYYTEDLKEALQNLFNYTKDFRPTSIKFDKSLKTALLRIASSNITYMSLDRSLSEFLLALIVDNCSYKHPIKNTITISTTKETTKRIYRSILLKLGVSFTEYVIRDGTIYISVNRDYLNNSRYLSTKQNRTKSLFGYYYKVLSKEEVPYSGEVYNLETSSHTYNVHGYAVHNCNAEHATVGKAQIVPANSANLELYGDGRGLLVPISHYDTNPVILTENAIVSLKHAVQAMEYAYLNREEMKHIGNKVRDFFMQDTFNWDNIANKFREIIEDDDNISE